MMRIRVDRRTPTPAEASRAGIPIGTMYKYLGVEIPDDLRFGETIRLLKEKAGKLYRSVLHQSALLSSQRYIAWKTLTES